MFRSLLTDQGGRYQGQAVGDHITFTVTADRRHFWSPWLNMEFTPNESDMDTTDIFCRFSPAPSIWTGFMLTHIALFTLAIFAAMGGLAQHLIEKPPTALLLMGAAIVSAGGLLLISKIGQRLARAQMEEIASEVRCIGSEHG